MERGGGLTSSGLGGGPEVTQKTQINYLNSPCMPETSLRGSCSCPLVLLHLPGGCSKGTAPTWGKAPRPRRSS